MEGLQPLEQLLVVYMYDDSTGNLENVTHSGKLPKKHRTETNGSFCIAGLHNPIEVAASLAVNSQQPLSCGRVQPM